MSYETSSAYLNSPKDFTEIHDGNFNETDELNKLRRLVAHYRGSCKRLEISIKDFKSKSGKEVT
jgi:hypothetical protein